MHDRSQDDRRPERNPVRAVRRPKPVPVAVEEPSTSIIGIVGYAALGMLCAALAGISFLFIAAPVDLVRDQIIEEVRAQTGRELKVGGPVSLSLFPTPGVTLNQVSLAQPAGMGGGPTFAAQKLSAQVGLTALLSRRVHIRRVVLSQPLFNLVVDRNGRRNWDFALMETGRVRLAQARGPVRDSGPSPGLGRGTPDPRQLLQALSEALPGELSISDGQVRYVDERSGENLQLSGLGVEIAANDIRSPVVASGRFVMRGQPIDYSGSLSSLEAALLNGRAGLNVRIKGAPIDGQFEGTVGMPGGVASVDGSITFKSPSVATLGMWLGRPMGMADAVQFTSRVQLARQQLTLSRFDAALGGRPAQGTLSVDFNPQRPKIAGAIDLASLDLGTLLMRDGSGPPPAGTPPAGTPGPAPKGGSDPIGDIIKKEVPRGPQVRGYKQKSGGMPDWSDEQLDTTLLAAFDADLKLSAQTIVYHGIKTGRGRLAVALVDRQLRMDLEDIDLYQGRGRGVVTIDAAVKPPASTVNLNLEQVAAGPFMKDALGHEWLEGPTSITVAVAGQGYSERQFVETLSGTVDVRTNGGTISGFSIPKIVRGLEMGQIPALQVQPNEKTPFTELGAQYVISRGVAQNNDLRLYTQYARLTGVGSVNLAQRTLAYDLKARISGTGGQPGAIVTFSNIEIPIRVEGPWDKPTFGLKGQDQMLEAMRQVSKALKGKEVEDVLRGIFGKPDGKGSPGGILEKLLKP